MRVLVCGGRNFSNRALLFARLDDLLNMQGIFKDVPERITVLIHGAQRGADICADLWARTNGIKIEKYPAMWRMYGPFAGPMRNALMISQGRPRIGVAFPGNKGTADMVNKLKLAGIKTYHIAPF